MHASVDQQESWTGIFAALTLLSLPASSVPSPNPLLDLNMRLCKRLPAIFRSQEQVH